MATSDGSTVLYFHPSSFYSHKVLVALEIKGVKYHPHVVNLPAYETYAPWYMKINPQGAVPTFKHGDKVIPESNDIMAYVDKTFDGPSLYPAAAKAQEVVDLLDTLNIFVLTFGRVQSPELYTDVRVAPEVTEGMKDMLLNSLQNVMLTKYKSETLDDPVLQAAYQVKLDTARFNANDATPEILAGCLKEADSVFDQIENQLEEVTKGGMETSWLVSKDFTAADISLLVTMNRMTNTGLVHSFWSSRPRLAKYKRRLLTEKPGLVKICGTF